MSSIFFLLRTLLILSAYVNSKRPSKNGFGVYDGQITQWSEYPYIASIRYNEPQPSTNHCCAGTIISLNPPILLTAAHCVYAVPNTQLQCRNTVIIGCDHADCDNSLAVAYEISSIVIHPDFIYNDMNDRPIQFDIALVSLSAAIDAPVGVEAIVMSPGDPCCMNLNPVTVIGYGKTGIVPPISNLTFGEEAWLRPSTCNAMAGVDDNYYEWPSITCFGDYFDETVVVCDGDDGGPVVDAAAIEGQLVGIISWEWDNFRGIVCDAGKPQSAANIGFLYDWITEQMGKMEKNVEQN